MHKVPSGLWGYVRDDTHLVGWETGAITPLVTMLLMVYAQSVLSTLWVPSSRHVGWGE